MNADGSEQRELGPAPDEEYFGPPAWSPNGRTIAHSRWDYATCGVSSRNCAGSEIVVVDVTTGAVRRVVRSRDRGAGSFSWAPDGSRLAYAGERDMDLQAHTLETIRSDGSGRRVVLRLPRGAHLGHSDVAWSPRGDRLLFRSARGDSAGVVDLATRRVQVLARAPEVSASAWSPDGRRIALELRSRGVTTLSVVRVSDTRRLHSWQPGGDVTSLFFSHDGGRLVYARSAG